MNPFDRLAPYIREFVWQQGWAELRQMQGRAIEAVLDTNHHVLLAGATASGKTEAAFLPILTDLEQNPSSSIAVLYLGPLKALINDQFERLEVLLAHSGIGVWPWHGDVGQAVKKRAIKAHEGVLQTTPESLEGFFVYRKEHLGSLFGDLRYVVIDEVHAFMASDRGRQVLCQLARLERIGGVRPRRIGLSATLGDYELAKRWLRGGGTRPVDVIDDPASSRHIRLAMDHYKVFDRTEPPSIAPAHLATAAPHSGAIKASDQDEAPRFIRQLADLAYGHKSLVFVKSRANAEWVTADLRELAEQEHKPDIYFIHHGSISKEYRLDAEEAMRAENKPACTVATVTLELGIDLGQLERVMQVGPSPSVSSFVQRLGRTGRRHEPGEMFLFSLEDDSNSSANPLEAMPWDLLLTISQVQLYIEEHWVEPVQPPVYPFSLLYHQTMSILLQFGDSTPAALAERVLTLPPFGAVGKDRYKALLQYLLESDHLQWTEDHRLLIGLAGEKVVGDWRFLATFPDNDEVAVTFGSQHIGSLASLPPLDAAIRLAGRTWHVVAIDERGRSVVVEPARGRAEAAWAGGGGEVHDRVMERLNQVLVEDVAYPYLRRRALERLEVARDLARSSHMLAGPLQSLSEASVAVIPWLGTRSFRALSLMLRTRLGDAIVTGSGEPYWLKLKLRRDDLIGRLGEPPTETELSETLARTQVPMDGKFDAYVPEPLLIEAYLRDRLDLQRASEVFRGLR